MRSAVEPPNLATIPAELMTTVEGPAPGLAAAEGSVSRQSAIHGHDRRELAVCKARLDGLIAVVKTERALLVGPAPAGAR